MKPSDTTPPSNERHAELIAAAREQFQRTPPGGDSSRGRGALASSPVELQNYKVVRELHRGGQGVVYLAWQRGTQRQVAIKMVREGPFASPSERARFQREVEILGALKHPNIVTIHDSGVVGGSSYYVMDFVDGLALDDHVRAMRVRTDASGSRVGHRRFVRDTLSLFARVCDAVQEAHLRGVIHRDLKPSNVRVDMHGEPRVLDFGLAKSTVTPDASSALPDLTLTGQFVGTLAYASPEQAGGSGDELDVRTDVYSLGVMLYEVLTDHLPYVVAGPLLDVLENIRHVEPARPSSHVDLPSDLETILLKCLNKARERRYQAAGELAEDLRRHIEGKPIEAKRDSAIYLLRMFARRHWAAALTTLAFVALLGVSSVTLGYMYAQQVQLRERAQQNEEKAMASEALAIQRADETRKVAEFQAAQLAGIDTALMGARLRQDVLDKAHAALIDDGSEELAINRAVTDLEATLAEVNFTDVALESLNENIFEQTIEAVNDQFAEQPIVRASLLQTLADTMRALGLFDRALTPQTEALAIRRNVQGNEDPDTLSSICNMGLLLDAMGRIDEAAPYYDEALDARRRVLGEDHVDTIASLNNMGALLVHAGQYDEALTYFSEAVEGNRRLLGDEDPDTLTSINNLGYLLRSMGRYDEAMIRFKEALDTRRRVLGSEHPRTLNSVENMGTLLQMMGKLEDALAYCQEALDGRRRVLGDFHPETLQSVNAMGVILQRLGRYDEAMVYFREALEGNRRVLGDEHAETLIAINNMGHLLHTMGRLEEALPYYQEALETFRRTLGPQHPNTLTLTSSMGSLLKMMGRTDEAATYFREALAVRREILGDEHPQTLLSMLSLGALLQKQGNLEGAMEYYREALDTSQRVLPNDHRVSVTALAYMGSVLQAMDRQDEALPYCSEVLEIRRRDLGDEHPNTIYAMNELGVVLYESGRFDEAEQLLLEAASAVKKLPPEHALHEKVTGNLAALYDAWHAENPLAGHDQDAARWRNALAELEGE